MASRRVRKKGIGHFSRITWNNDKTIGKATYTVTLPFPITRCHCDTHHRFCCMAGSKVDERSVNCDSMFKRKPKDSKRIKGKTRRLRRRGHHSR